MSSKTVKQYQDDPIHENVRMFERELKQKFPQLRVTSSFRPRAFTKQGKVSNHALGRALDLGYDKEIADYLANTYEGVGLLNKYGLGVLDESTKEVMNRTGATGAHLHVGMDSGLVAKAKERYKELTPKQNITPELTDFDYTPQTPTFALEDSNVEEEDAPKEEDKSKEVAQAKEALKEEQFMSDLFKGQIAPIQVVQEEALQQAPQSNLLESFANIESFVDSPLAQQGLTVPRSNNANDDSISLQQAEYETAMRGMMKSKIGMGNAMNNPAIVRMSQSLPKTGMTPEGIGTHYMSSMDNYAIPFLQDTGAEELQYMENPGLKGEAIRFNSDEEANYFAKNYKQVAPMSNYQQGGQLPRKKMSLEELDAKMTQTRALLNNSKISKINLKERPKEVVRENTQTTFRNEAGRQVSANPNQQISTKHINERRTESQIIADRKAKLAESIKAQDENVIGNSNWRDVLARETQSTGDKFRIFPNEDSFIDNYLNPGVMIGDMASNLGQAPLQAQQSDSYMPYITSIGTPLAVGAMAGYGTQGNTQFVNNLVNPLAGTGDILKKGVNQAENIFENNLDKYNTFSRYNGTLSDLKNIPKKGDGVTNNIQPFSQEYKEKVTESFNKGNEISDMWVMKDPENYNPLPPVSYNGSWTDYERNLLDDEFVRKLDNIVTKSDDISYRVPETRRELIDMSNLDNIENQIAEKDFKYFDENHSKINGVKSRGGTYTKNGILYNETKYITNPKSKWYNAEPKYVKEETIVAKESDPSQIERTTAHENRHNIQEIADWKNKMVFSSSRGYYVNNSTTPLGRDLAEVMVEPIGKYGEEGNNLWEAAGNELDSELMARGRLPKIKEFIEKGLSKRDAIDEVKRLEREGDDGLYNFYIESLKKHFKPDAPYNLKKKALQALPATVPIGLGATYLATQGQENIPKQQKGGYTEDEQRFMSDYFQQGGIIKDNMGQWKHPGKITEIASPNITMKGVNYPVLGISKETGEQKLMMPNLDYFFNNTQNVIEYPLKK